MAVGHVTLDGREYMVTDERQIVRTSANQMAAKLGGGAGDYDDLLNWEAWLMDNWQAGVGKKDPTDGGYLFATSDSRFEGQLSLPSLLRHAVAKAGFPVNGWATRPYRVATESVTSENQTGQHDFVTFTVGETEERKKVALITGTSGELVGLGIEVLLYGIDPTGCQSVKVEVWKTEESMDPGNLPPDAMLYSATVNLTGRHGLFWHYVPLSLETPTNTTAVVVVYPVTGTLTIPTIKTAFGSGFNSQFFWTGSAWEAVTNDLAFMARYHNDLNAFGEGQEPITCIAQFNGKTYFNIKYTLLSYDGSTIELVSDFNEEGDLTAENITQLFPLGDTLYIAKGAGVEYFTMDEDEVITIAGAPATLFAMHNGFLWRALGGSVFYTGDEATWEEVVVVLNDHSPILGMGGINGELIVSTAETIYRITAGDIVLFVTDWGAPHPTNGKAIKNFQGNLYIGSKESVIRFDGENLLPYGPDLGEGLGPDFAGNIVSFAANNNWLLCAVAGPTSSVWAHNGQGWNFVAELPQGITATVIEYTLEDDNGFGIFAIGSQQGTVHLVHMPDTRRAVRRAVETTSPSFQYFQWTSWLETDWFYGGLREVDKDWESVYLDGENISETSYVDMYWKEEEGGDWLLLGRFTGATQEIRFVEQRPAGRRIKLAMALHNSFRLTTPIVTAIRVKFMPMVTDRWRWQIPVLISPDVQMLDGDLKTESVASQMRHLDTLTKRVTPFIFEDVDGAQYEVKVMSNVRNIMRLDYLPETLSSDIQYVYSLQLEQVTANAYAEA